MKPTQHQKTLVNRFFNLLTENPQKCYKGEIPEDMLVPSKNHLPSFNWIPRLNNNLTLADIELIQEQYNIKYPDLYKHWLLQANIFELSIGHINLYTNNPNSSLEKMILPITKSKTNNIIPIGEHDWSLNWLVFDYGASLKHEPTIKLFNPKTGKNINGAENSIVFSSFENLLKCWCYYLESNTYMLSEEDLNVFTNIDSRCKTFWQGEISDDEEWSSMDP